MKQQNQADLEGELSFSFFLTLKLTSFFDLKANDCSLYCL